MMAPVSSPFFVNRLSGDDNDSFNKLVLRLLTTLLIFFALAFLYVEYVSVVFGYYGFAYVEQAGRFTTALAAVALMSLFLAPRLSDVNSLLAALCHYFFVVPTAVMFVYAGLFGSIFLWTLLIQFVLVFISRLKFELGARTSFNIAAVETGLLILALLGLTLVIFNAGLFSLNFNIFEVYERRAEANEADLGLLGYIQQLGVQASLLLVASAFFNRRRAMTIIAFGVAVLYFGYTGHKSIVFWAVFLIGFLYVSRIRNKFSIFALIAALFTWLVAFTMGTSLGGEVANFLIRRTLFTPVLLNQYYVLFAEQFGYLNWSYSKIGLGFFEYTDTISPTQAVGQYLTGSDANSANTGMIGFGFINAGHAGIAIYLFVFSAIMIVSGALARGKGIEILGAAILVRASYFAVTTSDLPATFLSGGLGYALLLLLVYPSAHHQASTSNKRSLDHGPRVQVASSMVRPR